MNSVELLDDDPIRCAANAGLEYVSDGQPGFSRRRWGRGFTYRCPEGRTVRDSSLRERFEALVIPPAWSDVWICASPQGHVQATGRDLAGRKQYIYHPKWTEVRDCLKFDRLRTFGNLLPAIRERVAEDLRQPRLSRPRVLATVVRLLETTLVRVGNDEYARNNGSYGLTTIRRKHVANEGRALRFAFDGKSGKQWEVHVAEPDLVEAIVECLETPGYEVFKYVEPDGTKRDVTSEHVNAYLREISGARVTAKDFRTFAGTVLAATALSDLAADMDEELGEQWSALQVKAIAAVSERLGNTPAIARKSYVHPAVLERFEADLHGATESDGLVTVSEGLTAAESRVLEFLESRQAGVRAA